MRHRLRLAAYPSGPNLPQNAASAPTLIGALRKSALPSLFVQNCLPPKGEPVANSVHVENTTTGIARHTPGGAGAHTVFVKTLPYACTAPPSAAVLHAHGHCIRMAPWVWPFGRSAAATGAGEVPGSSHRVHVNDVE
jgi:hypothetical protein